MTAAPSRAERSQHATAMRADGATLEEIGRAMGIGRVTASDLINDPDGSKARARRDRYRGMCERCGRPTDGSAGPRKAPPLCRTCTNEKRWEERKWNAETIIAAFREFARLYGRSPAVNDQRGAAPSVSKHMSARRRQEYEAVSVDLPDTGSVYREFGTWGAALLAAGLQPTVAGYHAHRQPRRSPQMLTTLRLVTSGIASVDALSEAMGVSRFTAKSRVGVLRRSGLISRVGDAPRHSRGPMPAKYGLTDAGHAYLRERR